MSTKDLNLRPVDDKIRYLANSNLAHHICTGLLEHLNILPCECLNYSSYTIFIKRSISMNITSTSLVKEIRPKSPKPYKFKVVTLLSLFFCLCRRSTCLPRLPIVDRIRTWTNTEQGGVRYWYKSQEGSSLNLKHSAWPCNYALTITLILVLIKLWYYYNRIMSLVNYLINYLKNISKKLL